MIINILLGVLAVIAILLIIVALRPPDGDLTKPYRTAEVATRIRLLLAEVPHQGGS